MNRKFLSAAFAAMAFFSISCSNSEPEVEETVSQKITASVVDNGSGVKWAKTDVIGVYTDASENNVKYTTSSAGTSVSFTASTEVKGAPAYAYYPYSTSNSSLKATGLKGTLAQDQTAGVTDYRYGVQTGTNKDGDATFEFRSIFATVVFTVETSGSALAGQQVTGLECKVTRNGTAVPVVGGFTFSAADGAYSYDSTASNEFITLSKAVVFPTVKAGDVLEVKVNTAKASASVSLPVEENVEAGGFYPVTVVVANGEVTGPEEYDGEAPSITSLSFTAAANPGKILAKKLFGLGHSLGGGDGGLVVGGVHDLHAHKTRLHGLGKGLADGGFVDILEGVRPHGQGADAPQKADGGKEIQPLGGDIVAHALPEEGIKGGLDGGDVAPRQQGLGDEGAVDIAVGGGISDGVIVHPVAVGGQARHQIAVALLLAGEVILGEGRDGGEGLGGDEQTQQVDLAALVDGG